MTDGIGGTDGYRWTMNNYDSPVEALAEVWATIDGMYKEFRAGKQSTRPHETSYYDGYMVEAEEAIKRLKRRGYTLVKNA